MKIVILGAGEVGFYLAKRLSLEKHDLVVIDNDPEKCSRVQETLDVQVIVGNGSSQNVLKEARLESADMFIAASGVDEVNLIACMIASKMGVKKKLARVRNPEYYGSSSILTAKDLGVDLFIHPEEEVIEEIIRLLMRASASEIVEFEDGKVVVVGLKLDAQCPNLNKPLKEIGSEKERKNIRVVAILKGEKTIIPTGEDYLSKNDQVFIVAKQESIPQVLSIAGKTDQKLERIMILGGGKIGRGLAEKLERKVEVTLIEVNKEKSFKIASQLKKATVFQADGTEIDALASEGLLNMDSLIAVTSDDETNILSCLLAKHMGIQKTIALVNKQTYMPLLPVIGIDSTVNLHLSTASAILRFIRRGDILSAAKFRGIDAEVLEFEIKGSSKIVKRPLKKIGLPKGLLLQLSQEKGMFLYQMEEVF